MASAAIDWVTVNADGLHLDLTGTAPNEAARFRALNIAGGIIDAARIRDGMEVPPDKAIEAPRFSVEMLRNDDGIQLIGLLPDKDTTTALTAEAAALTPGIPVSAMLETAAYPAPEGWAEAFDYGVAALKLLPRSKISVAADGCRSPPSPLRTPNAARSRPSCGGHAPKTCRSRSRFLPPVPC